MPSTLKKDKADFDYLVVGCSRSSFSFLFAFQRTRRMMNFFLEPQNKAYHDLHATDEFYHIDINDHQKPDEAVNFFNFAPGAQHQYKLIFIEYCSLFKDDLPRFINQCNLLLRSGGILLIKGVLPDQMERLHFENSDFSCEYESIQYKEQGWAIYFKGKEYSLATLPFSLSESAQQLIAKSGCEMPPLMTHHP